MDILKVQEIRGYEAVTRIANAPAFIKGVANLRGTIVPIVDMRIKFNLGEPVYDQFTVVIILNIAGRVVGMVVDSVSDVIALIARAGAPCSGLLLELRHPLHHGPGHRGGAHAHPRRYRASHVRRGHGAHEQCRRGTRTRLTL